MAVLSKFAPTRTRLSSASATAIVNDLTRLYLQHRTRISRAVYLTLFVALINRIRNAIAEQKAASQRTAAHRKTATSKGEGEATGRKKVELNREFFKNLLRLLRICIPGWKSKEFRLLISHSVFLVLRTMISLYVAELDGKLVSSLVRGKGRDFLWGLVWWMTVAVPATFTNSMVYMAHQKMSETELTKAALLPPVQAIAAVSDAPYNPRAQQIPLANDLLYPLRARRPDQERGPAHHSRHCQVLEQLSRAVLQPRKTRARHGCIQLVSFAQRWW